MNTNAPVHRTNSQESTSSSSRSSSYHRLSNAAAKATVRTSKVVPADASSDSSAQAHLLSPGSGQAVTSSWSQYRDQLVRRFSGVSDSGATSFFGEGNVTSSDAALFVRPSRSAALLDPNSRWQNISAGFQPTRSSGMSNALSHHGSMISSEQDEGTEKSSDLQRTLLKTVFRSE